MTRRELQHEIVQKWKKIFDKLVVEEYHRSNNKGYNDSGISLKTYRELCERRAFNIDKSSGGLDAFYKELREKNICIDWVNAPMDIIDERQNEILYASTWEGRNVLQHCEYEGSR